MENRVAKYPLGIETFADIIRGGYAYVDKTGYVKFLLDNGKFFFVSRPRRFGKSLFISTLESYFEGQRDLFKGLALDSLDVDWTPRPVFRFTFNDLDVTSVESMSKGIAAQFSYYEGKYGLNPADIPLPQRFLTLIRTAYEQSGRQVAVLIDEYDSPLLSTLDEEKQHLNEAFREILRPIFTVLKSGDRYLHFAFITGVSRFSHTSLFSGANNIPDFSLDDRFAAICGITEEEMLSAFSAGIQEMAGKEGISFDATVRLLKENYDGYHFSKNCPDIYNPYSLIRTLNSLEFDDYWFSTGTPRFLVKILKRDDFFLPNLDCASAETSELTAKESYLKHPLSLMYESGYLTIKGYDSDTTLYSLGIPNKEVAKGLAGALLPAYAECNGRDPKSFVIKMRIAIAKGNPEEFMSLLQTFFEGNPYSNSEKLQRETYFKNNIYLVFRMLGFSPQTEAETCRARADMVMKTRKFIYVFELKYDGNAHAAMSQIEEKGYAEPYRHDGRKIICIGANYSSATNNIDAWEIKVG